jgi:raffinose/stachyose/melibiose transport system permease protein
MKAKNIKAVSTNTIAIIVSLIMFIPIYLVIVNSLKDQVQASSMGVDLPTVLHWENFLTVIEKGKLGQAFLNSMMYSTFATIIAITLSAMAAFVLSRNRTKANRYIYFLIIMGIAMPMNFVTLTKVLQVTHLIT